MNIHPSPTPVPHVAQEPARPPQASANQESARPVQPTEAAAGHNREQQRVREREQQEQESGRQRDDRSLSAQERQQVEQLQQRDREVRQHEAAHTHSAGQHARGGARFTYEAGPDGKRYAVGGEVSIDTSAVPNDPQATLAKARTIRRAALAPADPSAQDRAVAAEAARLEQQAMRELADRRDTAAPTDKPDTPRPGADPVGGLLDVFA